ncbi:MAG: hypothetical protein RIQ81_689 [Pseudomonadota bacterium]
MVHASFRSAVALFNKFYYNLTFLLKINNKCEDFLKESEP